MTRTTLATSILLLALTAAGCTRGSSTTPPKDLPAADPVVQQLATALAKGDVSTVPMRDAQLAQGELQLLMGGMDGLRPTVTPGEVHYDAAQGTATATLEHRLALGSQAWSWTTTAPLRHDDDGWRVEWRPSIVQSDLDGTTRLRHVRELPTRAPINGPDGLALVEQTEAYRVGVDKANLAKDTWQATARRLAAVLHVDPARYAAQVAAAGPRAFVPALTMRAGTVPDAATMPGVAVVPVQLPLAPSPTFAVGVLGSAAPATPEVVKASRGDVLPDDVVGSTGLQKRYDAQLRGTPGHAVQVVARNTGTEAATASPEPNGQDQQDAPTGPAATASPGAVVKELFRSPAKPGTPLVVSLDRTLQARAEAALSTQNGVASLVVVKAGSGDVLAAANSPAAGANPHATVGHYAPGSTFKVVSSLALLRKGMTPTTKVPCTATAVVNGRTFTNYTDFPASKVGSITLTDALANSCNTAFLAQHGRIGPDDLAGAAASLGMGVDFDSGWPSFYGSVPRAGDVVTRAADLIGQGTVEASPMAMAGVAASVASGHTVVPWLVASSKPRPKASLDAQEARQLQQMMRAVVTDGSGRVLRGVVDGAKTGTAEFGTAKPPRTHAWMIAWNAKYAVAAMVEDGESGSRTAAPLVKAVLTDH